MQKRDQTLREGDGRKKEAKKGKTRKGGTNDYRAPYMAVVIPIIWLIPSCRYGTTVVAVSVEAYRKYQRQARPRTSQGGQP